MSLMQAQNTEPEIKSDIPFVDYGIETDVDYQMAFKLFNLVVNEIIDAFSFNTSSLRKSTKYLVPSLLWICIQTHNRFGIEKNEENAFELYLKSVEKGVLEAQSNIGRCYEYGKGITKVEAKRFQCRLKSARA
ncbi:hypothetical protein Glove_228g103 [Diversispora epigaea]|uniref:Uncharacterized protein n=1 Tax=Diversispora epigaea TaxID=1348612 RepID=A0A397ILG5_9GLOM|nr:hypothetical protein Glove_228g103 [Diversispora epigaea]